MKIRTESHGSTAVVTLAGRLDAASATTLRRSLREALADGHRSLVLDFEGVAFVDSSGLSVLVTALKNARSAGGELALVRLGAQARTLLELTRLNLVFLVADDAQAAMAAVAA